MTNNSNTTSTYSYTPYQMVDPGNPNIRAVLMRYVRKWPWFLLCIGIALGCAYMYLLYKQPVYKIQASLLVLDEKEGKDPRNVLQEVQVSAPKKVVENEIEILRSATLMKRVVKTLRLDNQYYKKTKFGKREIYGESPVELIVERGNEALYKAPLELSFPDNYNVRINNQAYPLNQSVQTPYGTLRFMARQPKMDTAQTLFVRASQPAAVANEYVGRLKAEPTSKTSSVVTLTLEDAVPAKGEAILNQLISEYNQAEIRDKNKVGASTLKFIEDRLKNISGELAAVEKNVESYKSTQGITDLGVQGQSFMLTAKENDSRLSEVNIQLAALDELQKYVNSRPENRGGTPATVGLNDPTLLGLISKVTSLELERKQKAGTISDQNPVIQTLDNQIQETKTNIRENIQTMKSMLTKSKEGYVAKNNDLENQIRAIPQQQRRLMDIERQQTIKNELYTYLLKKREETAVSFAAAIADSRMIDAAQSSPGPVKPVKPMIYILFGLIGFLVPIGLIAGTDVLNTKVVRRMDVEESTRVPILGELGRNRDRKPFVITSRSKSMIAEQIRALRANLQYLRSDDSESQVLLFTSSISGEGKSFISLNLGASLALVDRPTVILEMDLRIPKLHTVFNLDNTIGISNYLTGEATLDEVLKPMPGHKNYFIITSGTLQQQNPAELLSGPRLSQLVQELRDRFQYVIIDTPPIGLVSDAQLVAPLADATFYVVRHEVTPKSSLRMVDTLHREQRFNNLNIILNAVGDSESYHSGKEYKNHYYAQEGRRRWLPAYQSNRTNFN